MPNDGAHVGPHHTYSVADQVHIVLLAGRGSNSRCWTLCVCGCATDVVIILFIIVEAFTRVACAHHRPLPSLAVCTARGGEAFRFSLVVSQRLRQPCASIVDVDDVSTNSGCASHLSSPSLPPPTMAVRR